MASEITVQQAWNAVSLERDSQNSNNGSASVFYIVSGAAEEPDAITAAADYAPDTFDGIPRKSVSVSDRLTDTQWKIEVRYAFPSGGSGGGASVADREPSFSFDVSQGEKRTLFFPIDIKAKLPANAVNPQTINDGEGVSLDSPVCTFSETHWFAPSKITAAWKIRVASMYKKINSEKFRGFEAGDVRFEGCSASRAGNDPSDYWQVTFKFAVRVNNKNNPEQIGNLGSVSKRGWDYLWCRYKEDFEADGSGKLYTVKKPVAAFVHQVFEEADFRKMGI